MANELLADQLAAAELVTLFEARMRKTATYKRTVSWFKV